MDLLKQLVEAAGIAGNESAVRDVVEAYARSCGAFDSIEIDTLGSLVCRRAPRPRSGTSTSRPVRVMLAAHLDQIGFLVSHVCDRGFIRLHPIGAFDPRTLFARRVRVHRPDGGSLPGTLNAEGPAVHTASGEELDRIPALSDFYVDVGLSGPLVRDAVSVGDMVVFESPVERVGEFVVGGALDDRVGCWTILRVVEALDKHDCEIVAVWTTQEELGSRGAIPVSNGIEPDVALSIDAVVCCDLPGVVEHRWVSRAGQGVAIQLADSSMISDKTLVQELEVLAQDLDIRVQRSVYLGGGQDGAPIQRSGRGVRTVALGCPTRHMHTANEMVHRDDLEACRALVSAFLRSV